MKPVLPGATLGIFGSGQLGRMLSFEAKRLSYRVHVFSPDRDTPAGQVSDLEVCADYHDLDAVRTFASGVDVVTVEFENIPAGALEAAQAVTPVHPSPEVLFTTQNRGREKAFLARNGFPTVPFRMIYAGDDLEPALKAVGSPAVLKTAGFGYDGKGQRRITSLSELTAAYEDFDGEAILEAFVDLKKEISVVAARTATGALEHFGVLANEHQHHVLDVTTAPADVPRNVADEALETAQAILERLDVVGVMCVEFFLTHDDTLLVNELAPRPHNSGHLTIEAYATSQFEQQLRAVCGLPLGSTQLLRPAAMANLLGDLWQAGEPSWAEVFTLPDVYLHLYGKGEARAGRKMGHVTALGDTADEAKEKVLRARAVCS